MRISQMCPDLPFPAMYLALPPTQLCLDVGEGRS